MAWDWTKAEQHGKWIESAYLSAIQRNDKALLDKARTMLKRIVDSQEESGYVGATSKNYRSDERPVRGMDAYELYLCFMLSLRYMRKPVIKRHWLLPRNWLIII